LPSSRFRERISTRPLRVICLLSALFSSSRFREPIPTGFQRGILVDPVSISKLSLSRAYFSLAQARQVRETALHFQSLAVESAFLPRRAQGNRRHSRPIFKLSSESAFLQAITADGYKGTANFQALAFESGLIPAIKFGNAPGNAIFSSSRCRERSAIKVSKAQLGRALKIFMPSLSRADCYLNAKAGVHWTGHIFKLSSSRADAY
jgi:hypothetical protein